MKSILFKTLFILLPILSYGQATLIDKSQISASGASTNQILKWNGTAWVFANDETGAGGVTGSGAAGQVTFWSTSSTLMGDTSLYWNNSSKSLGVGTSTLSSRLTVKGRIGQESTGQSIWIGTSTGRVDDLTNNNNIFIGFQAAFNNTSGENNNFIGYRAGYNTSTGSGNVFQGSDAGYSNTTASNNTFIGAFAGSEKGAGANNTFMGYQAGKLGADGFSIISAGTSVLIGADARPASNAQSNQIVIGYQGRGLGSNTTRIGNSSTTRIHLDGALTLGDSIIESTAVLDISSTTKGLLIPRMTTAQRDLISTPANGLQIYNTTSNVLQYFNGSSWGNVGGTGVTDLTFSGTSSPVTLNSSTGSDVTFVAGTNVSLSQSSNQLTINSSEVDGSISNEGTLGVAAGAANTSVITSNTSGAAGVTIQASTGLSISETTSSNGGTIVLTNSSPDQTVSLTGAGISSVTGTYPNFTITSTEVDGSTSNELQTLSTASNTVTLSNSGGSFTIAGAGINTVGTVGSTITVTGTEVDGSTTNEIQNLSLSGQSLSISSGTGVTLPVVGITSGTGISTSTAFGFVTITNTSPNVTTNLTFSGSSSPVTLNSSDGTDVSFVAGTNISLSQVSNALTINASEVDGSVSNEGILGVGAGGGASATITTNTSTGAAISIVGSTGISITEETGSNGGTITITNIGDFNPSDDITGNGAVNYIPVFSGSQTIDISAMYQNGTNIGIGASTINSKLTVKGSGSTNATSALRVNNSLDSTLLFIRNDGAVGFGTSNVNPISGATVTLGSTAGGTLGFRDDGVLVGYLNSSAEGTVLRAEGNRDLSILTNSTDRITIKGDGKVGVGTTTPKNNLDVNGSFGRGTMVKTAATTYTVAENDTYILLTASSNVTVTLPSASTWTRREIMIRSYGGDKSVSSGSSNVEFDGTVGTSILPSGTKYALLVSDGTNWVVITRSLN